MARAPIPPRNARPAPAGRIVRDAQTTATAAKPAARSAKSAANPPADPAEGAPAQEQPKEVPIPGYLVSIYEVAQGRERQVAQKKMIDGPGGDDTRTLLDYQFGADAWDRIRVRRRTFEDFRVIYRNQTGANQHIEYHLKPGKNVEVACPTGVTLRVVAEALPEDQWAVGKVIRFKAPRVTIAGEQGGWRVTWEPQQTPCVLTMAPGDGIKAENFPSFPFPSQVHFRRCSYFIPQRNTSSFREGGIARLGVRGAGLSVNARLPQQGQTVEIEPDHFRIQGAAESQFLTEQHALEKYNQWAGHLQYE